MTPGTVSCKVIAKMTCGVFKGMTAWSGPRTITIETVPRRLPTRGQNSFESINQKRVKTITTDETVRTAEGAKASVDCIAEEVDVFIIHSFY